MDPPLSPSHMCLPMAFNSVCVCVCVCGLVGGNETRAKHSHEAIIQEANNQHGGGVR